MVSPKSSHHPAWWLLLLFILLMVGLLILAHWLAQSPPWRIALEISIVLFSYGLFELWLGFNAEALAQDRVERTYTRMIIVESSGSTLPFSADVSEQVKESSENDLELRAEY